MTAKPTARFDQLAQKWSKLAERRRSHFIELYKTGRWKRYYTEAEFFIQLREAFRAADEWEKVASGQRRAAESGLTAFGVNTCVRRHV